MNRLQQAKVLRALVDSIIVEGTRTGATEMLTVDAVVMAIYGRCRSLYRAIWMLLDQRFDIEAIMLGRSLFEETLRLLELEAAGDRRSAMLVRWLDEAYRDQMALIGEAVRAGIDSDAEAVLAALKRRRDEAQGYRRQHTLPDSPGFSKVERLVTQFGLEHDYWTYRLAHQLVHGTPTAHDFRRTRLPDGTLGVLDKGISPDMVGAVAGYTMKWAMLSFKATALMLGWPMPIDVDSLLAQLEALQDDPSVETGLEG